MHRFSDIDNGLDIRLITLTVKGILYTNDGLFIIPKENVDATISANDKLLFTNASKALETMIDMTKDASDIIIEFGNK